MADPTYQTLIYEKQGGAELVVASGGKLTIESGGQITSAGTQAAHIANPTDLASCITAINAILVVLENTGTTASS